MIAVGQQVTVKIVDDIDGTDGAKPVRFGFEKRRYEIDLAPENEAKLREALAPFVKAARRAGTA